MRPIVFLMMFLAAALLLLPMAVQAAPCPGECPLTLDAQLYAVAHPVASLTAGAARGSAVVARGVAVVAAKPVKAVAKLAKALKNRERKPAIRGVAAVGKAAGRLIFHRRR